MLWQLHTFPEGKVYQDDAPIRRLKWGTASLVVRAPITPIVLPIIHHGFHEVTYSIPLSSIPLIDHCLLYSKKASNVNHCLLVVRHLELKHLNLVNQRYFLTRNTVLVLPLKLGCKIIILIRT